MKMKCLQVQVQTSIAVGWWLESRPRRCLAFIEGFYSVTPSLFPILTILWDFPVFEGLNEGLWVFLDICQSALEDEKWRKWWNRKEICDWEEMKCVHGHKRQKGEVKGESDLRKYSQTVNLSFFTNSDCADTQLLPVDGQTGVHFNPLKTEMDE